MVNMKDMKFCGFSYSFIQFLFNLKEIWKQAEWIMTSIDCQKKTYWFL